jgi:serine/threonine protein phosphatase PrpC
MSTSTQQTVFDLSVLRCAAGTDVGLRREENQDAFGVVQHEAFQGFFVADGMGGVNGGAIASRIAISTLQEKLPPLGAGISPEAITSIVEGINAVIFEQGAAQPGLAGMGTTLVGVVFTPHGMMSLNIGDSRLYRIRGGQIVQISEDHTLVRELVRSGAISSKDASHHPVSHMLTRSLGPLAEVAIECKREPEMPLEEDIYVLCSDGLYNFVSDNEILDVVRQNPLDDANQILINLANRRGGTDNITVIVVSVGESGGRRRGSEYRKARAERSAGTVSGIEEIPTSGERGDAGTSIAGEPSNQPPRVEEPRDYHAERESIKAQKKMAPQRHQGIPVPLLVCGAVLFGLIVGDVARRWGAFPDFVSVIDPKSSGRTVGDGHTRMATKLDDVSKELALTHSGGRPSEGLPDIARRVSSFTGSGAPSGGRRFRSDLDSLNKNALQSAAAKVEAHLKELASPPSPAAADALKVSERRLAEYVRELTEAETQIDTSSRKLSLWFGRKKKAEESQSDLFTPGGEVERVGAISERVKRKAAEWTEATYQLQAKQDEFELYPGNEGLRREVEALKNNRSNLQQELREEVLSAIDAVLADTYRQLEELKARRDIAAARVSTAQEEVEILQVLASSDEGARAEARKRLQDELEEIRDALSQMR